MKKLHKGIVQKNQGRASALGYPTINIPLAGEESGVYAARARVGEREYDAVAFADTNRKILETHILDFSDDLYGTKVIVELLKKIRDTRHFKDDEVLRRALSDDVAKARRFFKN